MELNLTPLEPQLSVSPSFSLFPAETRRLDEQSGFNEWISKKFHLEFLDDRCFSVNLNFVSCISRDSAQAQFKKYVEYLNDQIYGHAHKRFPQEKSIKLVAVLEGGGNTGKQVHYHTIIVNPKDRSFTDDEFSSLIKECWLKQPKSMKNSDIAVKLKKIYNLDGWVGYISKPFSKDISNDNSYLDFLDVQNSYF